MVGNGTSVYLSGFFFINPNILLFWLSLKRELLSIRTHVSGNFVAPALVSTTSKEEHDSLAAKYYMFSSSW